MFDYPVQFEKGPEKFLQGLEEQVQVFFVTALIDYFSYTRPSVTLALRQYEPGGKVCVSDMEKQFNRLLTDMVAEQKE